MLGDSLLLSTVLYATFPAVLNLRRNPSDMLQSLTTWVISNTWAGFCFFNFLLFWRNIIGTDLVWVVGWLVGWLLFFWRGETHSLIFFPCAFLSPLRSSQQHFCKMQGTERFCFFKAKKAKECDKYLFVCLFFLLLCVRWSSFEATADGNLQKEGRGGPQRELLSSTLN